MVRCTDPYSEPLILVLFLATELAIVLPTISESILMCKICSIVLVAMLIALSVLSYKLLISSSVPDSSDGRLAVRLEVGERKLVLAEMRAFLISVQQIAEGISMDDMEVVVQHARRVGRLAQQEVPASLRGKLPAAFKQLGHETHTGFDQMALDAEQLGDREHALSQLSSLLQNCVACHAAYRIELDL